MSLGLLHQIHVNVTDDATEPSFQLREPHANKTFIFFIGAKGSTQNRGSDTHEKTETGI